MVYVLTGAFIVFDFITGLIKAIKERNFNSSIMREGMWHKCGSILVVALATLVEYTQNYIDIGVDLPIVVTVSTYIVVMEVGSIVENIGKINPKLVPEKIKIYFFKLNDKGGN